MKKLFSVAALVGCLILNACESTPKQKTYNTIYTLQLATTAAFDSYISLAVDGKVPTNGIPRVSTAYNKFQVSSLIAQDAAHFAVDAKAPSSLITESQDVINLINEWSKK